MSLNKKFFTIGVRIHFVGIGGIGMCGLAELLHRCGSVVTGSDLKENASIKRLRKLGIHIHIGHKKASVKNVEIVVYSSAVPANNVEIRAARQQKILVLNRSAALSEVMRLKRGIVVAGTHGKTTTTGFLANIFVFNKKDPSVVVGGRSHLFQSTARTGKGAWFIAESDESDGGFKHLSPEIAVLTNMDRDHLDHYGSFKKLQLAFLNFARKVPFYGFIVAHENLRKVLSVLDQKIIFYGFDKSSDFSFKKLKSGKYQLFIRQQFIGALNIPLPGDMNALNALAAIATAMTLGLSFPACKKSFLLFKGVDRRFQKLDTYKGIVVYDDYAHHPTEIRAVLKAFREQYPKNRLVVLFQPHRFSRTASCWQAFLHCFVNADKLFLMDIYPAGEKPLKGVSSKKLAKQIKCTDCEHCSKDILKNLLAYTRAGDVVITMGAGDVNQHGSKFLRQIKKLYKVVT